MKLVFKEIKNTQKIDVEERTTTCWKVSLENAGGSGMKVQMEWRIHVCLVPPGLDVDRRGVPRPPVAAVTSSRKLN